MKLLLRKLASYFKQFSLRFLFICVTIVCLFFVWWTQPETSEKVEDGLITRSRQRVLEKGEVFTVHEPLETFYLDTNRTLLYHDSFRQGLLTSVEGFHSNGAKSFWGKYTVAREVETELMEMMNPFRYGVWRTWHPNSKPKSETHYELPDENRLNELKTILRDVDLSTDSYIAFDYYFSQRDGPAQAWSEDGQLVCRGDYKAGRREGSWTFYSEGKRVAEGNYRGGIQCGVWKFWKNASDPSAFQSILFVNGRPCKDANQRVVEIAEQYQSDNERIRFDTIWQLRRLGEAALPMLRQALSDESSRIRGLAVRSLGELKESASSALADIQTAVKDDNPHVKCLALSAITRIAPSRYNDAIDQLWDHAKTGDRLLRQHAVRSLARVAEISTIDARMNAADSSDLFLTFLVLDTKLKQILRDKAWNTDKQKASFEIILVKLKKLKRAVDLIVEDYPDANGPARVITEQVEKILQDWQWRPWESVPHGGILP